MRKIQMQEDEEQDELTHECEIDGIRLISYTMDPLMLYPMAPRMAKILAPILGGLGGMGELTEAGIEKMLRSDASKLSPVVLELAKALGEKENANLPRELLCKTVAIVEGENGEDRRVSLNDPKNINAIFRGKFYGMLRAMWFSLGVNFGNFSGGGSNPSPNKG